MLITEILLILKNSIFRLSFTYRAYRGIWCNLLRIHTFIFVYLWIYVFIYCHGCMVGPIGPRPPGVSGFEITLSRTSPDGWSALLSDCTWQHTTLTGDKTSMTPAGFEPVIPASEQPQTRALHRATTAIGKCAFLYPRISQVLLSDRAFN